MAFSFLPKEDTYFVFFSEMTEKIQEAADILVEMMNDPNRNYGSYLKRMKDVEHSCDDLAHKLTTKLNKSFITPFDREDIYHLSVALDDICDYIDAGARAIVMYGITEANVHSKQLARIIQDLSKEIHGAVLLLKKADGMNKYFMEVHRLENEADEVYFRAIGELFKDTTDPIEVIRWKEVYEILENATDRCESVANIIESIVLKHN